jgi:hypothetical protein
MLGDLNKPIILGVIVVSVVMLCDLKKPIILTVIILSVVKLNVISPLIGSLVLLGVIVLSVVMLSDLKKAHYTGCHCTECRYAESIK